jgi:hypothetical protein
MSEPLIITEDQIDDDVCELMRRFGPDRHIDGHDKITAYIANLLNAGYKITEKPGASLGQRRQNERHHEDG